MTSFNFNRNGLFSTWIFLEIIFIEQDCPAMWPKIARWFPSLQYQAVHFTYKSVLVLKLSPFYFYKCQTAFRRSLTLKIRKYTHAQAHAHVRARKVINICCDWSRNASLALGLSLGYYLFKTLTTKIIENKAEGVCCLTRLLLNLFFISVCRRPKELWLLKSKISTSTSTSRDN